MQVVVDDNGVLTKVTLDEGETTVDLSAHSDIEAIGSYVFTKQVKCYAVILPNSCQRIMARAFFDNHSVRSLTIGTGLETIEPHAVAYSNTITTIVVRAGNPNFKVGVLDGCLYEDEGSRLVLGCNSRIVEISNACTEIAPYAFAACRGIEVLTISHNATTIGDYAFSDCSAVGEISIPAIVSTIGEGAFYGCTGLRKLTIQNEDSRSEVQELILDISLPRLCFANCTSLETVVIPQRLVSVVTRVGECTFDHDTEVAEVYIPQGYDVPLGIPSNYQEITEGGEVTVSFAWGYEGCPSDPPASPKEVYVGAHYGELPEPTRVGYIFAGWYIGEREITATTICWEKNDHTLTAKWSIKPCTVIFYKYRDKTEVYKRYTKDYGSVIDVPAAPTEGEYIPSPDYWDFVGWENEETGEVIATGTMTVTEDASFLPKYTYKDFFLTEPMTGGVVIVGISEEAEVPERLVIPERLKAIGPDGQERLYRVLRIGDYAFYNQTSIREVVIEGTSLQEIGEAAFRCENYEEDGQQVVVISHLERIEIPDSCRTIGKGAFKGCQNLRSINGDDELPYDTYNLPQGLVSIREEAFRGCYNYSTIYGGCRLIVPQGVTSIGIYAFAESKFTSALVAGGSALPGGCFYGCEFLRSVEVTSRISSIGVRAFYGCPLDEGSRREGALGKLFLPSSITKIGNSAFHSTQISHVIFEDEDGTPTIPEMSEIGDLAFYQCSNLQVISIYVKSIGASAFSGCSSLEQIEFDCDNVELEHMGANAFYGCPDTLFAEYPSRQQYDENTSLSDGFYILNGWLSHVNVGSLRNYLRRNHTDKVDLTSSRYLNMALRGIASGVFKNSTISLDGQYAITEVILPDVDNGRICTQAFLGYNTLSLRMSWRMRWEKEISGDDYNNPSSLDVHLLAYNPDGPSGTDIWLQSQFQGPVCTGTLTLYIGDSPYELGEFHLNEDNSIPDYAFSGCRGGISYLYIYVEGDCRIGKRAFYDIGGIEKVYIKANGPNGFALYNLVIDEEAFANNGIQEVYFTDLVLTTQDGYPNYFPPNIAASAFDGSNERLYHYENDDRDRPIIQYIGDSSPYVSGQPRFMITKAWLYNSSTTITSEILDYAIENGKNVPRRFFGKNVQTYDGWEEEGEFGNSISLTLSGSVEQPWFDISGFLSYPLLNKVILDNITEVYVNWSAPPYAIENPLWIDISSGIETFSSAQDERTWDFKGRAVNVNIVGYGNGADARFPAVDYWCSLKFSEFANPLRHSHTLAIGDEPLHQGVLYLGSAAGYTWTNKDIPNYAFEGCNSLQEVRIMPDINKMGRDIFKDCNAEIFGEPYPPGVLRIASTYMYGDKTWIVGWDRKKERPQADGRLVINLEQQGDLYGISDYAFANASSIVYYYISANELSRLKRSENSFYNGERIYTTPSM